MRVTHARLPPLACPRHYHERNVCTVLLEGRWDEKLGTTTRACTPATTLTKPAGAEHVDRFMGGRIRVVLIEIDVAASAPLAPCERLFSDPRCVKSHAIMALAGRIAAELDVPDPFTPVVVEGMALELLGTAARWAVHGGSRVPPRWLEQARELIYAEFRSSPRISEIAAAVNAHPVQLARSFRAHWGLSPGEYLRKIRLDWAAAQLSTTDRPLAEVAASAGFADQSHFTTAFRRLMGVTPGAYRAATAARRRFPPG